MNSIGLRAFASLKYQDPEPFLVRVRRLELQVACSNLPEHVRALRTNKLKRWRELRQAALFCYFIGQRIGAPVHLANAEDEDYDFVAARRIEDRTTFTPVQLKELVPHHTNPDAGLAPILQSLEQLADSADLAVAIHLNQWGHFDPEQVDIPRLPRGSLWMFGAVSEDQQKWALWGDFLRTPIGTRHQYPAA